MEKVDELIGYTKSIMDSCSKSRNYNSIFFHSNENLKGLFDQIDVAGKDVLTVLSSGDQAFHFYDRDAKSVELYDINNLTLFYYYLRIWTIRYLNQYYPDIYFKNNFLERVLEHVEPKTEEEKVAYNYWKKFIWFFEDYTYDDIEELLIVGNNANRNELHDLDKLRKRLDEEDVVFYNLDLAQDVNLDKKYDVVFVSNIGDRIRGLISDERGINRLKIYKNNLSKLLKDDGMVIATHVVRDRRTSDEARIFEKDFTHQDLEKVNYEGYERSPGYYYRKVK